MGRSEIDSPSGNVDGNQGARIRERPRGNLWL